MSHSATELVVMDSGSRGGERDARQETYGRGQHQERNGADFGGRR
jgi:hypothetical protein